jgi:hypothetical protein
VRWFWEVAKAVCLALKHFHFGVETLGNSIVAGETPHGGNLAGPGGQSLAERDQWSGPTHKVGETGEGAPVPTELGRGGIDYSRILATVRSRISVPFLWSKNRRIRK